jgi:hypothetical protein
MVIMGLHLLSGGRIADAVQEFSVGDTGFIRFWIFYFK